MHPAFSFGPYVAHTYGAEVDREYRSRLGWITGAVDASIPWPQKDVLVNYQGGRYFLRGVWEREERNGPVHHDAARQGRPRRGA